MHTQDKLHRHTAHELIPNIQSFISLVLVHKWFHACTGVGVGVRMGSSSWALLWWDFWLTADTMSAYPSVLSCLVFSPGLLMPFEFQPQFYTDVTKGPGKVELLLVVLTGNCAVRLASTHLKERVSSEYKWVVNRSTCYCARLIHPTQGPRVQYASDARKVFPRFSVHFPFLHSFKWMSSQLMVHLERNFPVFFPFRVTYQHTHSEVKQGLTSSSMVLKYTDILHIYEFSYERQITIPFFPQNSS